MHRPEACIQALGKHGKQEPKQETTRNRDAE